MTGPQVSHLAITMVWSEKCHDVVNFPPGNCPFGEMSGRDFFFSKGNVRSEKSLVVEMP